MDLHEDAETNRVIATFELPGLTREAVNIDVHQNRLTISGENKLSSEKTENGYTVRERSYGKFSRSLPLPSGVKVSG
jgi:HSP20 family protein